MVKVIVRHVELPAKSRVIIRNVLGSVIRLVCLVRRRRVLHVALIANAHSLAQRRATICHARNAATRCLSAVIR